MSKPEGKKIAIKFTQPLIGDVTGNENAFIVTGQEYQYIDGPNNNGQLVNKTYTVTSISNHPTEPNSILLEFTNEFKNAQGSLTISYNQALGTLTGAGGAVVSFVETFFPEALQEGLTRTGGGYGHTEFIQASISGNIELKFIEKLSAYAPAEYIQASVSGVIQLKHIDDINP